MKLRLDNKDIIWMFYQVTCGVFPADNNWKALISTTEKAYKMLYIPFKFVVMQNKIFPFNNR